MSRLITAILLAAILWAAEVTAGCIGPVIMGKCEGSEVPWDSHPPAYEEPRPAPPGFHWDKRGTEIQERHPEWVDPFTGRDAHDSRWFDELPER